MSQIPKGLITSQEFIKRFPVKVHELNESLFEEDVQSDEGFFRYVRLDISFRTFRYYVTNKLMPSPLKIGKQGYYADSEGLYLRLYTVCFLTQTRRLKSPKIKRVLKALKTIDDYRVFYMYVSDASFFKELLKTVDLRKAFLAISDQNYYPQMNAIKQVVALLIRKEQIVLKNYVRKASSNNAYKSISEDLLKNSVNGCNDLIKAIEAHLLKSKELSREIDRI